MTDDSITVNVSVGQRGRGGYGIPGLSQAPQAGGTVTASLSDPDGGISGETWSWASSADGTDWTAIAGANAQTYTPSADDAGRYLQATASPTPTATVPGKSASAATASAVTAPEPEPPTITAGPTIVSSPQSGDAYGLDEAIVITITFSKAVTVTGQPRVRLARSGERNRWARYDHSPTGRQRS